MDPFAQTDIDTTEDQEERVLFLAQMDWTPFNLSPQQQMFVIEYLKTFDPRRAARRAGYSASTAANANSWVRGATNPNVRDAIQAYMQQYAASQPEIAYHLTQIARHSPEEFLQVDEVTGDFRVDFAQAKRLGAMRIIKSITRKRDGEIKLEFVDPLKALELLARANGMLHERREITINVYEEAARLGITPEQWDTLVSHRKNMIIQQATLPTTTGED